MTGCWISRWRRKDELRSNGDIFVRRLPRSGRQDTRCLDAPLKNAHIQPAPLLGGNEHRFDSGDLGRPSRVSPSRKRPKAELKLEAIGLHHTICSSWCSLQNLKGEGRAGRRNLMCAGLSARRSAADKKSVVDSTDAWPSGALAGAIRA